MPTINWNEPLEAYHPDGRVADVKPDANGDWPANDNTYWVDALTGWFMSNGVPLNEYDSWRIRNRTTKPAYSDELIDRMVELVRDMAPLFGEGEKAMRGCHYYEARAILGELEPVDPDEQLAGEVAEQYDDKQDAIIAAIKRVRAEYE